jgi:hypothetical protein
LSNNGANRIMKSIRANIKTGLSSGREKCNSASRII